MKILLFGVMLISSFIQAGEVGPYGGEASAPPVYAVKQPIALPAPRPSSSDMENSHNCVMCDCRNSKVAICCSGDAPGNDSCVFACCSTLLKALDPAGLYAEPDKPAQD